MALIPFPEPASTDDLRGLLLDYLDSARELSAIVEIGQRGGGAPSFPEDGRGHGGDE